MNILVFKTDIKTKKNAKKVKALLNKNTYITDCFVDIKDIDNVLRIEAKPPTSDQEIIVSVQSIGFHCETLNY
jgi:tRNA G26 N,N-dimethylase Trm1